MASAGILSIWPRTGPPGPLRPFINKVRVAVAEVTAARPADFGNFIAIANCYDTCAELRDCLESLRGATALEQSVVPNIVGSTDGGALKWCAQSIPKSSYSKARECGLIWRRANRVVPAASAIGCSARLSDSGECRDVVFRPGAIEGLCGRSPPGTLRLRWTGPRLINADGSLQRSRFPPLPACFRWMFDNDAVLSVLRLLFWDYGHACCDCGSTIAQSARSRDKKAR